MMMIMMMMMSDDDVNRHQLTNEFLLNT